MRDVDTKVLEEIYVNILEPVEENLVLKRKVLDNGESIFVVDSDLGDSAGRNETFKKKDGIKDTGLFYFDKANLRKWISKKSYTEEDFRKEVPKYKRAILSLNKSVTGNEPTIFDDAADEIEELTDIGAQDQITNFLEKLKKEVVENTNSPEVQAFMNFRKKFRKYSFNNQMLIFIQRPDATHVAGRLKWEKEFGRKIKKGSKAINIFIPIQVKENQDENTVVDPNDPVRKITRFKLGPIFDISDTEPIEGKEDVAKIPESPKWFSDETVDETSSEIYDALMALAEANNITVTVDSEGLGDARGVSRGGSIQLLQKNISIMVHEIAHELIHDKEKRANYGNEDVRKIMELQAEGVAYAVLEEFGINSEHASKYLVLWKIAPEHITDNQEIIRKTANQIIDFVYDYIHKKDLKTESFKTFFYR